MEAGAGSETSHPRRWPTLGSLRTLPASSPAGQRATPGAVARPVGSDQVALDATTLGERHEVRGERVTERPGCPHQAQTAADASNRRRAARYAVP